MKIFLRIFLLIAISGLSTVTAKAQFLQTGSGPYDYNVTSNWTGSSINGVFSQTLAANQTVGFSANTTLTTGLTFETGGAFNETIEGLGGNQTITLGGNISVNSVLGGQTVTFGSLTSGNNLSVNLGNTNRTFNVGTTDTLVFLNTVSNRSTTKTGLGTLIFGGSSVSPINLLGGGTLILDCTAQASSKLVSGANLGLTDGTFEVLGNSSAATTQTFMSLYLNNIGASNVEVISNGQSTILDTGNFTRSATNGATVDFTLPVDGAIKTSASNNANGILGGYATVGKSTWATNDGNGNIVGLTSYVNSISSGSNTDLISNQTVSSNVTASTLRFNTNSPIAVSIANGTTLTTGGILVTANAGNNLSQITGGTLASSLADLVVNQYNQAGALEIDSVINTTLGLTVSGPGTVILRGDNTYGNATVINGATLNISADNNLGSSFNSGITINGGGLQLGASFSLDGNRRIYLGDAGGTIDTNGFNFTFPVGSNGGTSISGTGGLTKAGNGTFFLDVYGFYSGATTISGGTLSLGLVANNTATLQGNGAIIFNGGMLQYNGDTTDYSSRIVNSGSAISIDTDGSNITFASNLASSNTGGLTKLGSGILTLSGANAYSGGTLINGGELSLGNSGALGTTNAISFSGGSLQFTSSNTTDYSSLFSTAAGQLYSFDTNGQSVTLASNLTSSGGSLTKFGTGILTLSGSNTYSGGTSINGGELSLGSSGALGTTGAISFGGGSLQFTANNTTDYSSRFSTASGQHYSLDTNGQSVTLASNLTSSGGSLTKIGSGSLTLSGTNSYNGSTSVNGGTLQVDGSIHNSATTVNSGASLQGTGTLGAVTLNSGSTLMAGDNSTTINKTLTTGNLLFNSGATLQFKLNTSLVQSDTINVTGNLSLNNVNLVLNDLAASSNALAIGTQFTLFTYTGTESGEFNFDGTAIANDGSITYGANTYQVQYAFGDPSVTLTVEAIPEPRTWVMLLGGLILLTAYQHRFQIPRHCLLRRWINPVTNLVSKLARMVGQQ